MMNAGGKYGVISDTISSLTTMTFDGSIIKHMRGDVEFEYRGCNLSKQIVIEVEFHLNESKIEVVLEKWMKFIMKSRKHNLWERLTREVYLKIHLNIRQQNLLIRQVSKV